MGYQRECRNCGHFDPDAIDPNPEFEGLCRARPPALVIGPRAMWPTVTWNDWCGSFDARPKPEPKPLPCGHEVGSGDCLDCMPF